MLKEQFTGQGRVVLLAGGGRIYTDIAARFVRSERSLDEIIASPYSKRIVDNILNSGHGAALVLAEEGLDGKKLFAAAAGLLRDDARIRSMAESMASLGIRDATERIYDTVMSLLK